MTRESYKYHLVMEYYIILLYINAYYHQVINLININIYIYIIYYIYICIYIYIYNSKGSG